MRNLWVCDNCGELEWGPLNSNTSFSCDNCRKEEKRYLGIETPGWIAIWDCEELSLDLETGHLWKLPEGRPLWECSRCGVFRLGDHASPSNRVYDAPCEITKGHFIIYDEQELK